MLSLKTTHELNWGELQYIENPMVAKTTVERNNGQSVNGEPIHNANNYNLPDAFTRSIDPYSEIHHKLENGHVFLVNTSTTNPLLKNLKISDKQTTQCTIMPGQTLMFKNAVNAMLRYVRVPQISGALRQEPSGSATVVEQPEEQSKKEKTKKKEEPSYKISIGVQGVQGVGSSDIRVCSTDFETPIKLKSVDKKFGKIEIDGAFKQNKGHREIALLDIDEGKYYSYLADHTGKGVIPLGEISTLEEEANANFNTALAAVVPMAYEDNTCNNTKPMPLKNGYLYIYVDGHIWREIKVDNFGKFKDVDLTKFIDKSGYRLADCHFDSVILLPAKINGETPKVQIAFSQCQWTWQRIRQLGGMASDDMRLKNYPDSDLSALSESDSRRKSRMGDEIDLSSWKDGMDSSSSDQVMAFDAFVSQVNSELTDIYDDRNENKKIGLTFLKESLYWANKAGIDYQLAWGTFREYLDDLKNPKHKDLVKKEEFKFSPYFESALLAHQYFFAENDDMKATAADYPPPERYRGPRRYSSSRGLNQAIKMRSDWADQLSLPDIERALGTSKRAALKDTIFIEKTELLKVLNPKNASELAHLKEEVADYASLEARSEKDQIWAYDQLWALIGELFKDLAKIPSMEDNGMDATPLTMAELQETHLNDEGHNFVFSVLDQQHWLSEMIFPKADASDITEPNYAEKSIEDYACDPNKLSLKAENDREWETFRRSSEFISGALLTFMDVSADKIGDSHIQSTARLLHTQTMGLKLRRIKATMGQFLLPELEKQGLRLEVPELASGQYQIRAAFGDIKQASSSDISELMDSDFKNNGIDIPNSKKFTHATLKNKHGTILGSVSKQIIEEGKGLHSRAWEVPNSVRWHTTEVDMWVIDDQKSLIGKIDKIKPSVMYGVMPALGMVQIWNIIRTIKDYNNQNGALDDPILMANIASAMADSAALALEGIKVSQKYIHSKLTYSKGVKSWNKYLMAEVKYVRLAYLARVFNTAAAGLSMIISVALMYKNYQENDDAMISHGVMGFGFGLMFIGALATSAILTMTGLGLVLVGAILLHWVFKENDLLEQWLELGPFSKQGIDVDYEHGGGRMKRLPSYFIDTDYGQLKLDKNKRLVSVLDQGDFEWLGDTLVLTKVDPLDLVDGEEIITIGKIGGPVNLDALANKSQRLTADEYAVVDDWRNIPKSSVEDLASIIYEPRIKMNELDGLSFYNQDRTINVNCYLNGLISDVSKFEFELWVRHKAVNRHKSPKLEKLSIPSSITKINGQNWVFEWDKVPVKQSDRFLIKYKVNVYGDNSLMIPGRYDNDGWAELWL